MARYTQLQTTLRKTLGFLSLFFPKGKTEKVIFFGFLLFYSSFAYYLAYNTSIIDNLFGVDIYFSFDNPTIFHNGTTYPEAHPLMKYIVYPIIFIGKILRYFFVYKVKTFFWTFICTSLISFSSVYIYRYLSQIVELKRRISVLLTLIYGAMSTNLILCFTTESFTFTAFFLSFMVFFFPFSLKYQKRISVKYYSIFMLVLGA